MIKVWIQVDEDYCYRIVTTDSVIKKISEEEKELWSEISDEDMQIINQYYDIRDKYQSILDKVLNEVANKNVNKFFSIQ